MKVIVSVDTNWGIGCRGNLLQRIPGDMKLFKQRTIGKVVVMGRETFESLPGKEPLKDRVNIVLSRNKGFINEKVTVCRSLEELFDELLKYDSDDVFVIGGAAVYKELLPFCSEAYITRIENTYEADRHFVDLDKETAWKLASESEFNEYNNIKFKYLKYENSEIKASCIKKYTK